MLHRQLPAYSPLPVRAFFAALARGVVDPASELERARALIAEVFAADVVMLVDSGSSALRLAIDASLASAPSRVVALPAFQCFEVATAAVGADARIVLYDVDPATLQPDMASFERALSLGASAVVVAPLYGLPVAWDALAAAARHHGATIIEDAAQAHGAEWRDERFGSLGALSVLSFGRGKGWTGCGGGALLFRDAHGRALAAQSKVRVSDRGTGTRLLTVAKALTQLVFGRPSLYGIPAAIPMLALGETRYRAPSSPACCSGFSASLLGRTFDAATHEATVRRENAAYWKASLPARLANGVPAVLSGATAGYLRFPLRLPRGAAEKVWQRGYDRAGIARSYPKPLSDLPAVAGRLIDTTQRYSGARDLSLELVTLPTHSCITPRDRARILSLAAAWR